MHLKEVRFNINSIDYYIGTLVINIKIGNQSLDNVYSQSTVPRIAERQLFYWHFRTGFCKCEISGSSSDRQPK